MKVDIKSELPKIKEVAAEYGVQWQAVAAIRMAEAGGPGREFGVLSVSAATYDEQLRVCCNSLCRRLAISNKHVFTIDFNDKYRHTVLRYSYEFCRQFAARWAPADAENDPRSLNIHWLDNFESWYVKFLSGKEE